MFRIDRDAVVGTCPTCRVVARFDSAYGGLNTMALRGIASCIVSLRGDHRRRRLLALACPACDELLLLDGGSQSDGSLEHVNLSLISPKQPERKAPPAVRAQDPSLADDFEEASRIVSLSPKASAALSRRCLQKILVTMGNAKPGRLSDQIEHVLPSLPSELASNVDAIRALGNLAAHPTKDETTGEIVEVEPLEADWLLDVLEELHSHYYVGPADALSRRDALNEKLLRLGGKRLKGPRPTTHP